jgi:hypothetical protein
MENKPIEPIEEKAPKILLEILTYGQEENKSAMKSMNEELQKQMDTRKAKNRVRILYYIDKGELSVEEKKTWLIDKAVCKYFVFAPENYNVSEDYVKSLLDKIKKTEDSIQAMKNAGLTIKRN